MKTIKKFDILLVILILAVVAIVAMKFVNLNSKGPGGDGVNYKNAEVEFVIRGVRVLTTDAIHIGDTIYSDETNSVIGKIVAVNIEPFVRNLKKIDGSIVRTEMPDKFTVTLVVETQLSQGNTGYFAHGITEIKINSEAMLYTKYIKAVSVVGGINFED